MSRNEFGQRTNDTGERRQATVLFADLADFTAFSERSGEEAAYSLMRRLSALMTAAIQGQGGTVKNFTGDGLMALFGVPIGLEDAPLRACRAATEIQRRLASDVSAIDAEYALRPQIRIGINTGPMIVGAVESGDSTGVTAIGDTVNFAARLQALAGPGGIVLSEATYRLVRGLVDVSDASEHEIKGKAAKQKIYRLVRIRRGATRFDRSVSMGLTTYVGRLRELAVLEQAFESAAEGLQIIDIVGEPGIGKSRLIHEFRGRISDDRVFMLVGSCTPDGQQTPFLPFIDIVRVSFRVSEGEAERDIARNLDKGLHVLGLASDQNLGLLLNLLGLKPPEGALKGLDGVLIGLRTRDLLVQLLVERSRLTPVIMVLEDLHWIDRVSEELLDRLVVAADRLPVLVVQTHRPEYRAPWADQNRVRVLRLELEPLTTADTSQIVCDRLGVPDLPAALARLVTDKAEGNPLFAEEIANYLVERGVVQKQANAIEYDSVAVAAALPGNVQSLLSARVDRLAPEVRSLLQAASVIGRRFSRDLLTAVTRSDDIDAHIAAIQALDLIQRGATSEEFAFKHALVRDALYNSLLQQPRSALHLVIAGEIEQRSHNRLTEVAESLAHHYAQTDRADRCFTYLVMAGEKSMGIYSLIDAERYFQQALALVEAKPECAHSSALIGFLAHVSFLFTMLFQPGKLVRLIDRYTSRIAEVGDSVSSALILANYSFSQLMMCEYRSSFATAEHALDMALRLDDNRSKAYARATLIVANAMLGQRDSEETQLHAKLGTAESDQTDDAYLQAYVRLCGAWDCLYRGFTDRGRALALDLQECGRKLGDPRPEAIGLWTLGWLDIIDERYEDALAHGRACVQVALTPFDREIGLQVEAVAQICLGSIQAGVKSLQEHRQRAIANDFLFCRSGTDGPFGIAMVLQGDFSGGIKFLHGAIEFHDRAGNATARDLTRMFLAETYIEFLAPKQKPPLKVMIKNLAFLIRTASTGWRKAESLLLAARENPIFGEVSHYHARIDTDLGILYKIAGRVEGARERFAKARAIAKRLSAKTLLVKIDELTGSL